MGLGYGSRFDLPKLSSEEFGRLYTQDEGGIAFLRILLTIAEVGLSFFTGPVGGTLIALGGASGQEAIDASQGQVSAVNTGINFGSALIPGVSGVIHNTVAGGKIVEAGVSKLAESTGLQSVGRIWDYTGAPMRGSIADAGGMSGAMIGAPDWAKSFGSGGFTDTINNAINVGQKAFEQGITSTPSNLFSFGQYAAGQGGNLGYITGKYINSVSNIVGGEGAALINVGQKVGAFTSPAKGISKYVADQWQASAENFNQIRSVMGDSHSMLNRWNPLSFNSDSITNAVNDVVNRALGNTITGAAETLEGSEEDIRKIELQGNISRSEAIALGKLLARATSHEEERLIIIKFLRDIGKLDSLRKLAPLATDAELAKILTRGSSVILDNPEGWRAKVRRWVESLGRPSSTQFNDNFVQKVQLLFDGSDAGRAPIEFAYGKVKRYIGKEFAALAKIIGKVDKIEEAYKKSGGVLVTSDVILGYKLIHTIGYMNLVQISFYPSATKSKKNPKGKLPVYVFASKTELSRLRKTGMSYYLKKWATSKNGRGKGFGSAVQKIFGGLTFFTGMFKINAIRNILSLASNMSTGFFGKGGIAKHGMFTGAWETKFVNSFKRNWKNRLGRLVGRAVIGGLGGAVIGKTFGSFIGREAQRAASQYVVPILTGQKMGSFKLALLTSLQSNLRRKARQHNPNSAVLGSLSNIRKGQIVQRAPGSFTAGKFAPTQIKFKIPR